MAKYTVAVLALLVATLASACSQATPPPPPSAPPAPARPFDHADAEAFLRDTVAATARKHGVTSPMSASITAPDGRVISASTAGADPAKTLFRVGSVSKVITAIAVLQQVEAGKLDLDADIRPRLDFPLDLPKGPVSVRQLLEHTAGFEDRLTAVMTTDPDGFVPLRDHLAQDPPHQVSTPGTVVSYSNYGNSLAGHLVERVSGEPWEEYVDRHITTPLGLTDTTARQPLPGEMADRLAAGIDATGKPARFEYVNDRPAGSVTATTEDMARFAGFLLGRGGDEVLSPEARRRWLDAGPDPKLGVLARGGYVSLGVAHTDTHGHRQLEHGGDTEAFHSRLVAWPEKGLGVFVSGSGAKMTAARDDVVAAIAERYVSGHPALAPPPPGSPERAKVAAGTTWRMMRCSHTTIGRALCQTTRLQAHDNGDLTMRKELLREVEPWVWRSADGQVIVAVQATDGRPTRLAPTPYFHFVPGGPFDTSQLGMAVAVAAGWCLLFGLVGVVVAIVRRVRRRDTVDRSWVARLASLAPWLAMAALVLTMFAYPLKPTAAATGPDTTLMRAAQAATVLAALGWPLMIVQVVRRLRARRIVTALAWLLTAAALALLVWYAWDIGVLAADLTP